MVYLFLIILKYHETTGKNFAPIESVTPLVQKNRNIYEKRDRNYPLVV
ncbi:hypothetical protein HC358_01105 [Wolbachia pipientis]|uniref:Uncharacterized protein n=1 Tax=Wolbachia pipientis TaxID=955 RepID=A0A7G5C950_WOLPI|nr:hypothetical protein [Wolbachia pipientis]QMV45734.1 hypothetical protein HC358_01105 [Wolbachia pipientis]